MLNWYSSGGLE